MRRHDALQVCKLQDICHFPPVTAFNYEIDILRGISLAGFSPPSLNLMAEINLSTRVSVSYGAAVQEGHLT
jgi:hypothetical protein